MLFSLDVSNSIMPVVNSRAAPNIVSGFYPHPQRQRIKSDSNMARGGTGRTFRPVRYETQSILITNLYRLKAWVGSPYAKELAPRTKRKESKLLAAKVSAFPPKFPGLI